MNHPELDFARYPNAPGHKRPGTSKAAADSMREKAPTLRQKVLDVLFHQDLTADECAAEIGKSRLAVRPRLAELARLGKIVDTGETRANVESGKQATVWRAV
jgi:predicted ArsR family transcriptional regulator